MTVCLAATCEIAAGGPRVAIVAADRMVTLGGFIEFEHAVPKMAHPSPYAIAMIAGDTLVGTRLAEEVAQGMAGTSPRVTDIARALAQHYAATRNTMMETALLTPRALTLAEFYARHTQLNPQITMMIDQGMTQFHLGVELLLAGVDGSGAHIFTISNPGGIEHQHDVIGYSAIGSGAIHAIQALIGFGHHGGATYRDTVFRVYAAKRRAEVAPGVGSQTDMAIVTSTGTHWLDEHELGLLEQVFSTYSSSTQAALDEHLEALNPPEAADETPSPEDAPVDGAGQAQA